MKELQPPWGRLSASSALGKTTQGISAVPPTSSPLDSKIHWWLTEGGSVWFCDRQEPWVLFLSVQHGVGYLQKSPVAWFSVGQKMAEPELWALVKMVDICYFGKTGSKLLQPTVSPCAKHEVLQKSAFFMWCNSEGRIYSLIYMSVSMLEFFGPKKLVI